MKKRTPKASTEQQTLRCAGYIRVSSQRQANEGDSLITQQREIEHELEVRSRRGSWTAGSVEFYIDAGKSAKDQKRPELQRLKRDVAAGRVDVVICFKLDRITRSVSDFVELWKLFEDHDVVVISLRENFDTSTPMGKAMLQIIIVFAELERKMTAERTYSIMKDRVDRGFWNGGYILGYTSDSNDKGKLIVDDATAPIVRMIFDLFQELGSAGAVLRQLTSLGISCPQYETRAGKRRGGNLFTKQKIIGILRNPIYIGRIQWGETFRDDCHQPLISKEQFEQVQHQLAETTKRRTNFRKPVGRNYILTGLLRCRCGAHMVGAAAHGRNKPYRYYVCNRQVHEGGRQSCQAPRIPADDLEDAVLERVRQIGTDENTRSVIVDKAIQGIDETAQRLQVQKSAAQNRLGQVRAEIGRLVDALKQLGSLAVVKVQEELTALAEEEQRLKQSIETLSSGQAPLDETVEMARRFLATWKGVGDLLDQVDPEQRNQILQHYVEVIELAYVDTDTKVGVYAMQLLPEIRASQHRDAAVTGITADQLAARPSSLEANISTAIATDNGVIDAGSSKPAESIGDADVLTEDGLVRISVQKAPREGFEPSTRRLTAGCSTAELSRNRTLNIGSF